MENGVGLRSGKERQPLLDVTWSLQRLGFSQKFAYGVGHVYNDICAAVWFSYALIFLQLVAGTGPVLAGVLLFLGQFVDAVATPIAGYIVNKGWHKKRWHLLGSLLVSVTFPAVFSICFMCSGVTWAQACYYSVFIVLFQSGWALVQIAHLSILPEMTALAEERASLNAYRYTASMASHIGVYVIAWYFLSKSKGGNMRLIGPADATKFEYIALLSSGIGAVCTVVFHMVLSKKWKEAGPIVETSHQRLGLKENLAKFYRSPDLYKVAIIYTSSRLFLTLSLEYMPLFINEVVLSESGTLASVPLVSFLSSAIASMCVKYISRCFGGSRATYFLGCVACIMGCVLIYLNADKSNDTTKIFGSALLFGAGSSITMVVSLCVTANLIGADVECGAFVYSAVTFADKLLNGIAVIIIEYMRCDDTLQCPFYYKDVLAFVNGSVAILGLLVIATLPRRLFITTDNL